jgi:hypothetical protein
MSTNLEYFVSPDEIRKCYQTRSQEHYETLLRGGALPYFEGMHVQRGQGIIGDLIRTYALPGLARAAPHLVRGAEKILRDVRKGRPLKRSLEKRGKTALKRAAASFVGGGEYPLLSD